MQTSAAAAAALLPYDVTDSLVGLGRTLRHAGVEASGDRVQAAVRAVELGLLSEERGSQSRSRGPFV